MKNIIRLMLAAEAARDWVDIGNALGEGLAATAENMFGNLLHRYGFTPEQRVSPLVVGMVERINSCRETVFKQWEANYQ